MTNRPLDREETDALKLIRSGLHNRRNDWLGGVVHWNDVKNQVDAMLQSGTTDGEDLAELTDDDARERPWVMCRDEEDQDWRGPHKLIAVKDTDMKNVVIRKTESGVDLVASYKFARQLTKQEKERYGK